MFQIKSSALLLTMSEHPTLTIILISKVKALPVFGFEFEFCNQDKIPRK